MPAKKSKTPEECREILEYFFTAKDNRMSVIAKKFGTSAHMVSGIVDDHFKKKMKNKMLKP